MNAHAAKHAREFRSSKSGVKHGSRALGKTPNGKLVRGVVHRSPGGTRARRIIERISDYRERKHMAEYFRVSEMADRMIREHGPDMLRRLASEMESE